jgi:hypothetical protein
MLMSKRKPELSSPSAALRLRLNLRRGGHIHWGIACEVELRLRCLSLACVREGEFHLLGQLQCFCDPGVLSELLPARWALWPLRSVEHRLHGLASLQN